MRDAQEWNVEERDTDRDRENEGVGEGTTEGCGAGRLIREEGYSGRWRRLFTISMHVETNTRHANHGDDDMPSPALKRRLSSLVLL